MELEKFPVTFVWKTAWIHHQRTDALHTPNCRAGNVTTTMQATFKRTRGGKGTANGLERESEQGKQDSLWVRTHKPCVPALVLPPAGFYLLASSNISEILPTLSPAKASQD